MSTARAVLYRVVKEHPPPMNFSLTSLASGLLLAASLSGCIFGQNCDSCGRCTGGSGLTSAASEARAATPSGPSVLVWAEPSGEVVVDVSLLQFINCTETRTESLFFRWNPNTRQLEPRSGGPSAQARQITQTTTGGGVRSYEDVAPGLTLQVSESFTEDRVVITAVYMGASQMLSCRGGFSAALTCQ